MPGNFKKRIKDSFMIITMGIIIMVMTDIPFENMKITKEEECILLELSIQVITIGLLKNH
jgi:hypothetical protein